MTARHSSELPAARAARAQMSRIIAAGRRPLAWSEPEVDLDWEQVDRRLYWMSARAHRKGAAIAAARRRLAYDDSLSAVDRVRMGGAR